MTSVRKIKQVLSPLHIKEGAGVRIKRLFPIAGVDNVDPFLLFDHFGSDSLDEYIAGFPMHPHRGMETVTYMIKGCVAHTDSTGRTGRIEAGDVQWMSAGRGILHEEMPQPSEEGLSGFQIWLNLPSQYKMKRAEYQEYKAQDITSFTHGHALVKLICGELFGQRGPVRNPTLLPVFADIKLSSGEFVCDDIDASHPVLLYVYDGTLTVNQHRVSQQKMVMLDEGTTIALHADEHAQFILLSGQPTHESIVRMGPFVMNTDEEVQQVLHELRAGTFPPN